MALIGGLALLAFAGLAAVAASAPTLSILAPTEGASIDSATLPISVDVQNLTLNRSSIGQSNVPGEGHFHIYIDNVWKRAETDLVTFYAGLSSGPHVLRIELAENNHTEMGVGEERNFTVQPGAPRVVILSPGNSSSWPSNSAELALAVENFTLNAAAIGGAAVPGEGHYRVLVNGVVQGEGATLWYNVTRLAVGVNSTVRVELVGNDRLPLADPSFDQIVLRPAPGAPELLFASSLRGAAVNASSLRAAFTVGNFTLDAAAISQPPVAGRGHYLAWIDGAPLGAGTSNPLLFGDLAPGAHTLVLELVNNDNTTLTARVVDRLQFTVLAGGPYVTIVNPTDPATVNASSVELELAVFNFSLSAAHMGQANVAGEGHWHVFVDGVDVQMGVALRALVSDLAAGSHSVVVELRSNDHGALAWPAFDTLRLVVPQGAARLTITSPASASTTVASSSIELTLQVQNFTLSAAHVGGAPVAGEGHWHLFVDGAYRTYGTSLTALVSRLSPGVHEVVLELYNNDHTDLTWPAFDRIEVTVPDGSPTLSILSPTPTTELPLNFTAIRVAVTNFSVVEKPDQAPVAGEGHWHVFVDGAFYGMAYTPSTVVQDLAPGQHTVRAVMVGNNHVFVSPLLADEVSFTVGGARAAIAITTPRDGATLYGETASITIALENFTIAANKVGQPSVLGEGHWHYFLDGVYVTFVNATTYTATGLPPGDHTITARLYNNDHSALDIRIEHVITLHIAGSPRVTISQPAHGLVTTLTTLPLVVAVTNFTLDPLSFGTTNLAGHGHYHIYVDGVLSTMESSLTASVGNLSVGPHQIRVELVNRDHTPIGVPNSTFEVIVTVQAAQAPPPSNDFPILPVAVAAVAAIAVIAALAMRKKKPE